MRNTQLPYWYWWYRPYYTVPAQAEICNGNTLTNDTGGIIIKFKALPDERYTEKDNVTFNYSVYTDVTDISGETHSVQQSINVGYQSLYLTINTDDKINKAGVKKLFINARNANYHDEKTSGTIKIFTLKSPDRIFRTRLWQQPDKHLYSRDEYYKLFPNDLYDDELNQYKWARGEKVFETTFNSADTAGVNISDMKKLQNGTYVIEAYCKDEKGKDVKDIKYVTLFSEGENEIQPVNSPDWFHELKPVAEPGEKASFIMSSAHKDVNYFLQVERDKKIVSRKFIPANMKAFEIPVTEDMRGNFVCHLSFVKNGRFYYHSTTITVPFTNKDLEIYTETFRNKLLPGQTEEWKVVIKNKKGEKETAELLASMYDASLDAFSSHYWSAYFYNSYYARIYSQNNVESISTSYTYYYDEGKNYYPVIRAYDALNDFDAIDGYYRRYNYRGGYAKQKMRYTYTESDGIADEVSEKKVSKEEQESMVATGAVVTTANATPVAAGGKAGGDYSKNADKSAELDNRNGYFETTTTKTTPANNEPVQMRKNFSETAFFYPQLQSNEKGEVTIKFTMPDAVTRWKFMTFAHTKDLKSGQMSKELVTQKQIMIQANAPRFLREGDKISFPVKISNTGNESYTGTAEITLLDAITNENITSKLTTTPVIQKFSADKGKSTSLSWDLTIPEGLGAVTYKVVARAANVADGEENTMPVLTNRMLVTESMPLPIRGNQTKTFSFEKLINQNNFSNTLRNHKLTLEFTSNPAWYAVQSLPYLMEYPYECAEQTFSRYYANSLASYIAGSKPVIKKIFDAWKNGSPEAFYSNLQKNQELKSLMLEETPWVIDAKDESESKRRVGLLFDMNRMGNELGAAQRKLLQMQCSNGGWPWFTGMPDDEYITQHIVCGFGHLDKLGAVKIRNEYTWWNALSRAVHYCDARLDEEFDQVKKYYKNYKNEDHLSYNAIQYLYARSFYMDVNVTSGNKDAYNYFLQQEKKYWTSQGRYMQSMICLSLFRNNEKIIASDIIRSLKENALQSEEMGMYYKENYAGYYWYESPIEAQSLIIEAFTEVAADTKLADELRIWLLKSKQTQNWKTTKATCEAVYALLLQGTNWLATEPNVEITLGNILVDPAKEPDMKVEAGTGYFKKSWNGAEIKPEMGKVKVEKKGTGISWGAVYWQYFEQLDKITSAETNLKLSKKLYVQKNTSSGPVLQEIKNNDVLSVGDKVKVRIELRVDRDMQYVHMKDMRASGFEPVNVLSGYKWQDGLGYYQSTRDAATNFFFSSLPKGTYVFEYSLNTSHAGNFSNGITSLQCMYAPEFTSHSEGVRVTVKK
ncbi:MAG TPA: alpha-2-macroglobulin family protein [Bacteroidia bacterium]|nr:alpha-2-macroglobulin family protein [Bacteroidia bacterium]